MRVARLEPLRPDETYLARRAATGNLAEKIARRREEPRFGLRPVFGFRTRDPIDATTQQHVALAPHLAIVEVVTQPVGKHRLAARAQLDVSSGIDVVVPLAFHRV